MQHEINDEPQSGFEESLRNLRPSPPALDRDRLMYLAGQRAGPRGSRIWPALTIGSWLACAAVIGLFLSRPAEVVTRTRVVRVPVQRQAAEPASTAADRELAAPAEGVAVRSTAPEPIWPLEELDGLLTAGGWHIDAADRQLAMASQPRAGEPSQPVSPQTPPKTYGELRRALISEEWDGSLNGLF